MQRASSIRPGQVMTSCSRACRDLSMMLFPLLGRVAGASSTSTPAVAIDAEIAPPSTSRLHQEPEPAATPANAKPIR